MMRLFSIFFFLISLICVADDFDGTLTVNGCSGGLVILERMNTSQKAMAFTNGHCIRLKHIRGGQASFLSGEYIYELTGHVGSQTSVELVTARGRSKLRAERLLFATMTGTDIAIYELEQTYDQINSLYGVMPIKLDPRPLNSRDSLEVVSAYYARKQHCEFVGFVDLNEGPYNTQDGIKLSKSCDFYIGISGSPILRQGKVVGLANTSVNPAVNKPPCSLGRPCEIAPRTSTKTMGPEDQSYGVPLNFLYQCMNQQTKQLDFRQNSCPYHWGAP